MPKHSILLDKRDGFRIFSCCTEPFDLREKENGGCHGSWFLQKTAEAGCYFLLLGLISLERQWEWGRRSQTWLSEVSSTSLKLHQKLTCFLEASLALFVQRMDHDRGPFTSQKHAGMVEERAKLKVIPGCREVWTEKPPSAEAKICPNTDRPFGNTAWRGLFKDCCDKQAKREELTHAHVHMHTHYNTHPHTTHSRPTQMYSTIQSLTRHTELTHWTTFILKLVNTQGER